MSWRKTITVLFASASVLAFVACGGNPQADQATAGAAPAQQYPTLAITTQDVTTERSYSATIRGKRDIDIFPQVSGALWQINVTEGQAVKRGQVLFVVDQVPYQAALQQANAGVAAAETALSTAQLNYDARQRLYNEKIISEIELRTAENSLRNAQASVAQAKAAQTSARNNLSYTTVTSPADGVVGTIPYRQGTLVSSAMAQPLTTVSDNADVYVYFSLDETTLLNLARQYGSSEAAIAAMGEAHLRLSDGSLYAHTGRVESISGVIDRSTGSASLRASFPNPDRMLRSGASGSIILPEAHTGVIVIPRAATMRMQDKVFVYRVVDGKATMTLVTILTASPTEYIVTSGLSVGDVIVADGAGLVREGTQID